MKIKGKILKILPFESGMKYNRPWRKQNLIVQPADQSDSSICLTIWNAVPDIQDIKENFFYIFDISFESKEANGHWFNNFLINNITKLDEEAEWCSSEMREKLLFSKIIADGIWKVIDFKHYSFSLIEFNFYFGGLQSVQYLVDEEILKNISLIPGNEYGLIMETIGYYDFLSDDLKSEGKHYYEFERRVKEIISLDIETDVK